MKLASVLLAFAMQSAAVSGAMSEDTFPFPLPSIDDVIHDAESAFCKLCKLLSLKTSLCKLCPGPPPARKTTVYNLIEPKYTGVTNKDAGDFAGDVAFIFSTFTAGEAGNPEANIEKNVLEMNTVTVEKWSPEYLACNAPGAVYNSSWERVLNCPKTNADYCCVGNFTKLTADSPPGYRYFPVALDLGGYWMSFPKESEGKQWTQKLQRRIQGSCLGNEWRKDSGGCPECGKHLDQCVAKCIQKSLQNFTQQLRPGWDRAFANRTLCPDQPGPEASPVIVV